MSGRLLFLQNGPRKKSIIRLDERFEAFGLTVDKYWAYNSEFPESLDDYDGIFLSGSPHGAYEDIPFINREHELIRDAAAKRIPILGICFGSQILASALCGRDQVFRRPYCEVGYKWLPTTPDIRNDEIASGLGDKVYMFVWHNDEVRSEHPDMKILASSDLCPNQIWRHRDLPAWGIQGHPEVTVEESKIWFQDNRERLEKDGANVDELNATADEALPAKTMLTNFAQLCMEKAIA